jgi:leucine-rich repeat protein SHOC2
VAAEIGQLTSLTKLALGDNKLTSLPAEIGRLTSLSELDLRWNLLTSVSAAIRELRAADCQVHLDDAVTFDE